MKNNFLKIIIIPAFSFLFIISCKSHVGNSVKNDQPNINQPQAKQLPSFIITDVKGNEIDISSLKGKKVFVNLWASWCPPCREEIPSIEQLKSKVSNEKVAFVLISLDDTFDKAKQFIKSTNLQLPVYYPAAELPTIFVTPGIPATFIFNEKGELIKENSGGDNYDTDAYVQLLKS